MSVTVTNSGIASRLTIRVVRYWDIVFLLYVAYLWTGVHPQRSSPMTWLLALASGIGLLQLFTSFEELELYEERLEWRTKIAGFTLKSDKCDYSDIDVIEWRVIGYFPVFGKLRQSSFIRKSVLGPIKVGVGSSKGDQQSIRDHIERIQPALVEKFRYPDEQERSPV